jgi:hypothetical protein
MRTALMILLLAIPIAADEPAPSGSITLRIASLVQSELNRSATDQDFRKELLRRKDDEQKLRTEVVEAMKKSEGQPIDLKLTLQLLEADRVNREWLKGEIEKKGWPGFSLVGYDGSDAAWLLVQHADADLAFQKKAMKLLEDAVKRKDVRPVNLAYLTDRVLCAEGKKQVYGTQFITKDGKMEPKPIEDEANVDKRRAEVGLKSLAEYRKVLESVYGK